MIPPTLTWLDHLALVALAALMPLVDARRIRRSGKLLAGGEPDARWQLYRYLLAGTWIQVTLLLAYWILQGRPLESLGLRFDGASTNPLGFLAALLFCLFAVGQWVAILRRPELRRSVRDQISEEEALLVPRTPRELRWFDATAWTAGIGEEILYRGFLIAYFQALFGVSFWVAGGLSAVVFGGAHLYQGPTGILKTGAVGACLVAIYGWTGSLWAPIAAHVVWDLVMGRLAHDVLSKPDSEPAPSAA